MRLFRIERQVMNGAVRPVMILDSESDFFGREIPLMLTAEQARHVIDALEPFAAPKDKREPK